MLQQLWYEVLRYNIHVIRLSVCSQRYHSQQADYTYMESCITHDKTQLSCRITHVGYALRMYGISALHYIFRNQIKPCFYPQNRELYPLQGVFLHRMTLEVFIVMRFLTGEASIEQVLLHLLSQDKSRIPRKSAKEVKYIFKEK